MRQALGLDLTARRESLVRYFFLQQKSDGSWGLATNHRGDVSTTAETYLALRILGVSVDDPRMKDAERYVLMHGGLEKMRVFTRINFAIFGLFPWEAVPTMLPELILCPPSSPANIYALSSWARGTMVPLLILFHVKPLFALPNGRTRRQRLARSPLDQSEEQAHPVLGAAHDGPAGDRRELEGVLHGDRSAAARLRDAARARRDAARGRCADTPFAAARSG